MTHSRFSHVERRKSKEFRILKFYHFMKEWQHIIVSIKSKKDFAEWLKQFKKD
jgi:hypothetical protein